jgi:curli production assembly/transport component CsgG
MLCRGVLAALGIAIGALSGCSQLAGPSEGILPPVLNPVTETNRSLRDLSPPSRKVAVAVYGFQDQTGQLKPSDTSQSFSKAVTQGGSSVLIKALQDAGNGKWFTVVERERLDNLLKERRIIIEMRQLYLGEKELNTQALPPLLFAGVLLDGGIIGYDTNTRTGGAGANYLGIGGSGKYREDAVTVYLRATSTKTGEVLNTVVVHKAIASIGVDGNIFKYVALDKILQTEAGFTKNEPAQVAVQQAVEKAVYALIVDGAERKLWRFADKAVQARLIASYRDEQFGESGEIAGKREAAKARLTKPGASAFTSHPSQGEGL